MRRRLILLLVLACASCGTTDPENQSQQDIERLRQISREFLMAFEPQNVAPEEMHERALRHFERGPDFTRTVDATFYPSYDSLARTVRNWMEERQRGEWDQHTDIEIVAERALLLDDDAGVVTQVYRERGIDEHNRSWEMPFAAITYVFSRRDGVWRIVYYHGSHGPRTTTEAATQ